VPPEILAARRWLTDREHYEIKKHPIHTMRLLERMCGVPPVVPLIAYQLHERPNGSGYPQGRPASRIHLMAAILGVADAYCALVSPRPFRPALIPNSAIACLIRHAVVGNHDTRAVRALLNVQSLFAIGSYVTLSNGSVARVLRRNGDKYAQPIVRIVQDENAQAVPEDSETAIVDLAADGLEVVQALRAPGSHTVGLTPEILCMGTRLSLQQRSPESHAAR
jgi:HD-GYP domain-containing protein (c-di-GMP phosphodiesterase class II)